ncbi:MAG TPA: DUF6328 family protein [Gemmatimonadales bacterium]
MRAAPLTRGFEGQREALSLAKSAEYLLDECRMVLPGIQALFGFQLIAVFSDGFNARVTPAEQRLHLAAITLVAVAIALIMTPAAYHRIHGTREITEIFVKLSNRLVLWSMAPLAAGIAMDLYIVARLISGRGIAAALAAIALIVFVFLWGVLPRISRLQRMIAGP